MKKIFQLLFCILLFKCSSGQIETLKVDGGSVITKLGLGINVNDGSTLKRDFVILNSASCPVKLKDVGITTAYSQPSYCFKPVGGIAVTEPITAFEIYHVLYDVFGNYIETLSNFSVSDINDIKPFDKYDSWYATESEVKKYFTCVSYVASVRTKSGVIWRYNFNEIKDELSKIKIAYEEGYVPTKKDK